MDISKEEKERLEEQAIVLYSKARSHVILRSGASFVFFATLALRLKGKVNWDVETAATDGKAIYLNPSYWCGLNDREREAVLCHEVLHPALLHHTRRMGRDPLRWNIACDAAINQVLENLRMSLPGTYIIPGKPPLSNAPKELTAEEYYHLIDKDELKKMEGKMSLCGAVMDAPGGQQDARESEERWQQNVAAAHEMSLRKGRGDMPGWMEKVVGPTLKPKVDWRQELCETIKSAARTDYAWIPGNKRFVHRGLYLPALSGETIGDIVFFIDTSGSCWDDDTLSRFASEVQGAIEAYSCKVHIVYADTEVQKVDTWEPGDGPISLRACGGGGTSHVDCWRWIKEQDFDPSYAICLTDGYTEWGNDPGVPVIWALTVRNVHPPFGKTVYVEE